MIGDYTESQSADMLHRSRAGAMVDALLLYQRDMNNALRASLIHGDDRSADDFRADARAALHMWPDVLALIEPPSGDPEASVSNLCERVGEWTGR